MAPPLTFTTSSVMPRSCIDASADGGERLVELERGRGRETCSPACSSACLIARDGCVSSDVSGPATMPKPTQLGERRDAERVGLGRRHHDDGRAAVGDLRRVAGGDACPSLANAGRRLAERLGGGAGTHALVGVDEDRVALALRDRRWARSPRRSGLPSSRAAARSWLLAATSSCTSRVMPPSSPV